LDFRVFVNKQQFKQQLTALKILMNDAHPLATDYPTACGSGGLATQEGGAYQELEKQVKRIP
jgi:hypothetical protein